MNYSTKKRKIEDECCIRVFNKEWLKRCFPTDNGVKAICFVMKQEFQLCAKEDVGR